MKDSELVVALRRLKINTKSLACLGCNYEHNCGVHGCHLIGCAADRIVALGSQERMLVHDFEICTGIGKLAWTLKYINERGYTMVSATQDASGVYTVFFRRPVRG